MTLLINQRSDNDCALAAISMAVGHASWSVLWNDQDLEDVKGKGVADTEPYLARAGLYRKVHHRSVYTHGIDAGTLADLLWKRKALLSIASLNTEGSNHMVYWDGDRIWDPQEGRPGKMFVRRANSVAIQRIILLSL